MVVATLGTLDRLTNISKFITSIPVVLWYLHRSSEHFLAHAVLLCHSN